jgi:hypothetical protein
MFEPNTPYSPENYLLPWMIQNMRHQYELGNKGLVTLGKRLLTGILCISDDPITSTDIYKWLESDEAKIFLLGNDPEGTHVYEAYLPLQKKIQAWIKKNKTEITEEALEEIFVNYIEKNYYQFKYELEPMKL